MAQTHANMIYQAGKERGYNLATWIDAPELGKRYLTESDGYIVATEENLSDVWFSLCYDAEANGRQFSPFEFTARELNNLQAGEHCAHFAYTEEIVPYPETGKMPAKLYDVWELFDQGITEGIALEWNSRLD